MTQWQELQETYVKQLYDALLCSQARQEFLNPSIWKFRINIRS
jgi:hypothetical protein